LHRTEQRTASNRGEESGCRYTEGEDALLLSDAAEPRDRLSGIEYPETMAGASRLDSATRELGEKHGDNRVCGGVLLVC
jgi:hypothetical protein